MAIQEKRGALSGLARKLVAEGLLSEENAHTASGEAQATRTPLVRHLVERGHVDGDSLAHLASEEFGVPFLDISSLIVDPETTKLVSRELIQKHEALPLYKRGQQVFIGIADPTDLQALNEIKFHLGSGTVEAIVVEWKKLSAALDKALDESDHSLGDFDTGGLEDFDDIEVGGEEQDSSEDIEIDDAPVVRFVNKCLVDAIKKGASDLHFEPYEKSYRVRFRIDGVLEEVSTPPLALSAKIAARIKVMSRLDVSERRVPQDGRIKLKISKNKAIDFRVSTCPTLYGEKTCLRILDSDAAKLNIEQLGYEEFQKDIFLNNLKKPYGMFLVTGPTGSGKTVSLYTGINILNQQDVNISTAEDPVEINLPGVNQVQVDERTGMSFPKALRAFLRQDPDIILVGEIRDLETGSIAVKAAQTGHMVMSTLHTNDAPQTLTRLQDMGIQPFAVATSVNVITAQRLCRKLHSEYRVPYTPPTEALVEEGFPAEWIEEGFNLYNPGDGNADCPSGYKGRTGIYQVMPISDVTKRLIIEGANAVTLSDQALKEGIWDIRTSGLAKAKEGITSLGEINRVTLEQ